MSKRRKLSSSEMVSETKKKVWSCSTPEPQIDSPTHDSDSVYDSDAASPVPFICTQDGTEGETDVVWNFYTPKSDASKHNPKNTTPLSRKGKKCMRPKLIEKSLPRRKPIKPSQKNTELFQELFELKQNLHEYIHKPKPIQDKPQSDEDMFSDTSDSSPKCNTRTSSRCLRKNVLSSKFNKLESGLESDDSMNDCLIKASQIVEENVLQNLNKPGEINIKNDSKIKTNVNFNQDSMEAILSKVKLDSSSINNVKKINSPRFNNDSFDNLFENLNDSVLERLSQMPVNNESLKRTPVSSKKEKSWFLQELVVHDGSATSSSVFGRHNSMPESPVAANINKPSTSGMAFGRYNSMPFHKCENQGDSPIKCTPEEIKKKHQQAREKLIAKRLLPFTLTQQSSQPTIAINQLNNNPQVGGAKKNVFQPKIPSDIRKNVIPGLTIPSHNKPSTDIKLIIEKKRQEALMKLRKRLHRDTK